MPDINTNAHICTYYSIVMPITATYTIITRANALKQTIVMAWETILLNVIISFILQNITEFNFNFQSNRPNLIFQKQCCLFDQLERCANNRIRYDFTVYEIYTTYMHIQTIKKYLCNQGLRTNIS